MGGTGNGERAKVTQEDLKIWFSGMFGCLLRDWDGMWDGYEHEIMIPDGLSNLLVCLLFAGNLYVCGM